MIDNHQNAMSDGHGCAFLSSSSSDATKLSGQVPVFLTGDDMSGLQQQSAQPGVAFAGLSRKSLACTLVIARTNSRPRCQVPSRRKLLHVESNFSENAGGR